MDATQLRSLFRRVMLVSLAAPASIAAVGCGGMVTAPAGDKGNDDGGTSRDAVEGCSATPERADTGNGCFYYMEYACGIPGASSADPMFPWDKCVSLCGSGDIENCWRVSDRPNTVACGVCSAVGRRPAGLCDEDGPRGGDDVGNFFARVAELEAASIRAFRVLRDELVELGAPRALVFDAERAARDEVRHARATTRIARRYRAEPRKLQIEKVGARTLEQIAIENAVEGCVRETFGALIATHQAEHAGDALIARVMKKIARDETRHAALAWQVDAWLESKLDDDARARVSEARSRAVSTLLAEFDAPTGRTLVEVAGFPEADAARRLAVEMRATLWAA